MIERLIRFDRDRHVRCSACGVVMAMYLAEFELWSEHLGGESICTSCGADEEPSERVAAPGDPAHDAGMVRQLAWYHTSTQPNWPSDAWEPTAGWVPEAFERMEHMLGPGAVDRWRADQLRKCLHLGTYETAVENVARRRRNQADSDSTFYLYRVQLAADAAVRSEVITDPGGQVGDVLPEDVMSADESITRYINAHEGVGSISLAVRLSAVAAVQCIPLDAGVGVTQWADQLAALDAVRWRAI